MTEYTKPKGSRVPQTERFKAMKALENIIVKFGDKYVDENGHVVFKEGWTFPRLLETLQASGETYDGYASPGGLYNLCKEVFGKPRPQGLSQYKKEKKSPAPYHEGMIVSNAELHHRVRETAHRLDSLAASMVTFDKRLIAYDEVNKALEESLRQTHSQVLYLRKVLAQETDQRRAVQQKLNDFLVEWGKDGVPLEEPGPRLVTTR